MPKNDPPAFQLYAADFYMDTTAWSATQVGIYFRLLMHEWVNGSIPNDEKRLARIGGIDPGNFKKAWVQDISKKFTSNGEGDLVNRRLEAEREKQRNYYESQRKAGYKGAKRRWGKYSDPNSNPNGNPNGENMALQSSSSKKKKNRARTRVANYIPKCKSCSKELTVSESFKGLCLECQKKEE